jgi:hypothetical protein
MFRPNQLVFSKFQKSRTNFLTLLVTVIQTWLREQEKVASKLYSWQFTRTFRGSAIIFFFQDNGTRFLPVELSWIQYYS